MCYVTHSLRFTSGATPANLFVASMAAKLSLPHTCKALVGLETGSYHAATHSVRSGRPDALPTELSQLGSDLGGFKNLRLLPLQGQEHIQYQVVIKSWFICFIARLKLPMGNYWPHAPKKSKLQQKGNSTELNFWKFSALFVGDRKH